MSTTLGASTRDMMKDMMKRAASPEFQFEMAEDKQVQPPALQASGLIGYCKGQLRNIDSDINSRLALQENLNALRTKFSTSYSLLQNVNGEMSGTQFQEIYNQLDRCIQALPESSPAAQAYKDKWNSIVTEWKQKGILDANGNAVNLTKEKAAIAATSVKGISDEISGSAEVSMMELQQFMSQRQVAVQLISGIMSKFQQTLEEQARKIGA